MRLALWTAFWVFLLDQATKYVVVHALNLVERLEIDVLPPLLTFRMAWNRGVNFGLFSGYDMRWVLIGVALAIVALVLTWIWRDPPNRWASLSAARARSPLPAARALTRHNPSPHVFIGFTLVFNQRWRLWCWPASSAAQPAQITHVICRRHEDRLRCN